MEIHFTCYRCPQHQAACSKGTADHVRDYRPFIIWMSLRSSLIARRAAAVAWAGSRCDPAARIDHGGARLGLFGPCPHVRSSRKYWNRIHPAANR
jgi:hypothetical protein